jgi:hypothetical protein
MAVNMSILARKGTQGLLQKLAPLEEIEGVRDYFFTDRNGTILVRKPDSAIGEEVAVACAKDMAQVGEILGLFPGHEHEEKVFDFHFKGVVLIAWCLGEAYLVALCREGVSLAVLRMTFNVIKEELRRERRFKGFLQRSDKKFLPTEQDIGNERYRHVLALNPEPVQNTS